MPSLRPRVVSGDVREKSGRISVGNPPDKDGVLSAIAKWVPVEVIAFYEGITIPFGDKLANGLPYAIALGAVVTFLWILFATSKADSPLAWRQAILSLLAFVFWVVGTTSPDIWKILLPWWHPGINPATLATAAVALPIADGILRRFGVPQD